MERVPMVGAAGSGRTGVREMGGISGEQESKGASENMAQGQYARSRFQMDAGGAHWRSMDIPAP